MGNESLRLVEDGFRLLFDADGATDGGEKRLLQLLDLAEVRTLLGFAPLPLFPGTIETPGVWPGAAAGTQKASSRQRS